MCKSDINKICNLNSIVTSPRVDLSDNGLLVMGNVKFWTKHGKTSDRTTGKIVSVTNRTSASAYVLCHLTLLLSLFQKYRMLRRQQGATNKSRALVFTCKC